MKGYFHTDSPDFLPALAEAVTRADMEGKSFRISVENGILKYKVGGGAWSPPVRSTPDPYRDTPLDWEVEPEVVAFPRLTVAPDGSPVVSLGQAQHESHDLSHYED